MLILHQKKKPLNQEKKKEIKYRDNSIETNLIEFEKMD